jgi:8-oxo-dGTP diphosphatase
MARAADRIQVGFQAGVAAMTPRPLVQGVAGLVRRGPQVLLVREALPPTGRLYWSLPGGVVEAGELLHEAIARELAEETGLQVSLPSRLVCVIHNDTPQAPSALVCVFEFEYWSGRLQPDDPDGRVLDAGFFAPDDAIARLRQLPRRVYGEPLVAYLQGQVKPGATWLYRAGTDSGDRLLATVVDRRADRG